MPEPCADPERAEDGRRDRDRPRLARLGDPVEREGEDERREQAAEQPLGPAELARRAAPTTAPAKPASTSGRSGRVIG